MNILARFYEHNNWANLQIIDACSGLTDEQLDAKPLTVSEWSIRQVIYHLVESQQGYLALLTLPPDERGRAPLSSLADVREAAERSGNGLLALARDESGQGLSDQLTTTDGHIVEPWVVMLQAINHATDHRRQISTMFRLLGVTPPRLDGWQFGEVSEALIPSLSSS